MPHCHHGNLNISVCVRANLQLAVILLIVFQASSVAGQDPAIQKRSSPPSHSSHAIGAESNNATAAQSASLSLLVFDKTLIEEAREGHATLTWKALAETSTYRVSDAYGSVLYSGAFPQAFVSGLEDGKHQFTVLGLDSAGRTIAISQVPAVVVVRHWPMAQAMALFAIGAVVFFALVAVLSYGAIPCRGVEGPVTQLVTERVTERRGDPQS